MDSKSLVRQPPTPPQPPPLPRASRATPRTSVESSSESEELQRLENAPPFWNNNKKKLSKQLSMCETPRDKAWEKRRRNQIKQERKKKLTIEVEKITDEDFKELKGSIELGFRFNEEGGGQKLCNTLPALDLYFAVNRQLSPSPVSTPSSLGPRSSSASSSSFDSPTSEEAWKVCGPGDSPQQVKAKLRHWAQAVACSVMQSF